ncbi:MAG: transcriptional repressor [Sedimentisphaerales bacterium]|nr:transcriptional repressor [Sedimentisphaerales bacterium]
MNHKKDKNTADDFGAKIQCFVDLCRDRGLRVTPQRLAIYKALVNSDEHPSAEMVYEKVRGSLPTISLDTVNRTLLTFSEIGAAFVVEGSGGARRFDAGLDNHQHFKCVKCNRIIDFHHEPFDDIELPASIDGRFTVSRKTVYVEGLCELCQSH